MSEQHGAAAPDEPRSTAVGLDWISTKKGWAYCRINTDSEMYFNFGQIEWQRAADFEQIQNASFVVVDAPIGLSPGSQGAKGRPCDTGARRWVGELRSSVQAPPVRGELEEWRRRLQVGERQLQGHYRGLLPAINAAELIAKRAPRVIESHPELVFSALAEGALPINGSKKTLPGLMARGALLQQRGLRFKLADLPTRGTISTDNYFDAAAMALVALAWSKHGAELSVIRKDDGNPERLGESMVLRPLMALPGSGLTKPGWKTLDTEQLLALASKFIP